MSEVKKVLDKWAIRTVQNMKRVLSNGNKVNTGRLYNSINYTIDEQKQTFQITYIGYGKFVDSGRRIGAKQPPLFPIKQWLSNTPHGKSFLARFKGTGIYKSNNVKAVNSAAFLVARSISRKGIKPVRFLNQESKIKNVTNVFGSLKTDLVKAIAKDTNSKKII
jgi:hypothetical protein